MFVGVAIKMCKTAYAYAAAVQEGKKILLDGTKRGLYILQILNIAADKLNPSQEFLLEVMELQRRFGE